MLRLSIITKFFSISADGCFNDVPSDFDFQLTSVVLEKLTDPFQIKKM